MDPAAFICGLQFNDGILLNQDFAACRYNIFRCKQSKNGSGKNLVTVLFFFQNIYLHLLASVLPVCTIGYHRGVLVTVGKVYISWLIIQYISIGGFFFDNVIFTKRQIVKLCDTCSIRCDGTHQLIFCIVIFTDTIRCFNILSRVHVKGNIHQTSSYITKEMFHHTFCIVKQSYII